MSEQMAMCDLASRGVHPQVASARRLDPYWDGLWASGSTASWVNARTTLRQEASGLVRRPHYLRHSPESAWAEFTKARGWRRRVEMLGALWSWRTLTAQQLAAMTGSPSMAGNASAVHDGMLAGLLDEGVFASGLLRTQLASEATLVRPAAGDVFDKHLAPLLTYPERVLVTGGRAYTTGGAFDRHNLLTAELGLRAAEFTDVGTVLGESLAGLDDLVGTGLGNAPVASRRAGDAVLVRPDGMRVVVEMTASITPFFRQKVANWAKVLTEHSMASSGLTVLFVGAPAPDRHTPGEARQFANRMRKAVTAAVREHPGIPGRASADRIGVAMWEDYFPAPGMVSEDFLSLAAWRRDGNGQGGSQWGRAGMLDVFDTPFEPLSSFDAQAIISQSAAIASAPVWLRRGQPELPLHQVAMCQAGLERPLVTVPRDARDRPSHIPGVFRGPGANAKVPLRLRTTPSPDQGS